MQLARPADYWINYQLAVNLELKKQPDVAEAIRFYQAALAMRPQSPVIQNNLANALHRQGKLAQAEAAFHKAIELKPDYADAYTNLGNVLQRQGKLAEAEAVHRKAIEINPGSAAAHCNLGGVLKEQGRLQETLAECRLAIKCNRDFFAAHDNLARELRDTSQWDEAITEYREVIRLRPGDAGAHNDLGYSLFQKGRLDEASKEFRRALALKQDFAKAHSNLGSALYVQGQLDKAITQYIKAIELEKDNPELHRNLGKALNDKGRLDDAIKEYLEAIRLKTDYAPAYYYLGHALAGKGQLDAALAAVAKAIRIQPDYAEAYCDLGRFLEMQGRFTEALTARQRGHALGCKRPDWHYPSAQWVREAEQMVKLDAKLVRILRGEAQPSDDTERLALARLCHFSKRYSVAVRFLAEAFASQPALTLQHRYNAACSAALAGCGQDKDMDQTDVKEFARLRRQALAWLRADLAVWRQALANEPDKARRTVQQQMQAWEKDIDFAGVRSAVALAKLPENERQEWTKLWQDVARLRKQATEAMGVQPTPVQPHERLPAPKAAKEGNERSLNLKEGPRRVAGDVALVLAVYQQVQVFKYDGADEHMGAFGLDERGD
jgi:tetratricopeptide (TPR) repeat protein